MIYGSVEIMYKINSILFNRQCHGCASRADGVQLVTYFRTVKQHIVIQAQVPVNLSVPDGLF